MKSQQCSLMTYTWQRSGCGLGQIIQEIEKKNDGN